MTLRSSVAGLEMPVLLDRVLVGVEEPEVSLGSVGESWIDSSSFSRGGMGVEC
jgi:hypothetical protein